MLHQHHAFRLTYATTGHVGIARPPGKVRHVLRSLQPFSWLFLNGPNRFSKYWPLTWPSLLLQTTPKDSVCWAGLLQFESPLTKTAHQ